MDLERLAPFVLAVTLVELTPGPNMGYLAIVSGQWGRRAGVMTLIGVTAGLSVYMLAAVFGLTGVVLEIPWLYGALRWAGVLFLLWLAWDAWQDGAGDPGEVGDEPPSPLHLLTRGFLANILNPKAAVFYIGLLPGFTDPARPFAPQALTLGLVHIGVSIVIHGTIVLAAARAEPLIDRLSAGGGRPLRAGFAAVLVLIAAWLAWETRR